MAELMSGRGSTGHAVPVHLLADLSWIEKLQINQADCACGDGKKDHQEMVGICLTDGMAYTMGVNKAYEDL